MGETIKCTLQIFIKVKPNLKASISRSLKGIKPHSHCHKFIYQLMNEPSTNFSKVDSKSVQSFKIKQESHPRKRNSRLRSCNLKCPLYVIRMMMTMIRERKPVTSQEDGKGKRILLIPVLMSRHHHHLPPSCPSSPSK